MNHCPQCGGPTGEPRYTELDPRFEFLPPREVPERNIEILWRYEEKQAK